MQLGFGLGIGSAQQSLAAAIRALFAKGEQGGWYDPSDFSTLFQDSSGTTPVTSVGQPVGLILDKSGRGNHRIQGTTPSRPTLQQDASGFFYLQYDGIDDFHSAPMNMSATDKVVAIMGLRKLSDTATAVPAELTANTSTVTGGFRFTAPQNNATGTYSFASRGTGALAGTAVTPTTFAAPTSNVLTGIGDISGRSASIRVNDAVAATDTTTDQGTGNFANRTMYWGMRGGTTLPFSGREYQSVVVGRLLSAFELAFLERFVGAKMGIAL